LAKMSFHTLIWDQITGLI